MGMAIYLLPGSQLGRPLIDQIVCRTKPEGVCQIWLHFVLLIIII